MMETKLPNGVRSLNALSNLWISTREKLPAKDAPDYDEKFKEMIGITGKAFKEDNQLWSGAYESMKETLLDS